MLATLAFLAAAAIAADEPVRREKVVGSRLARRVESAVWDTKETREVQAEYGRCVIKKHPQVARHFVLTPNMEKSEWRKDVAKVADGHCLAKVAATMRDVQMTFPVDSMRYALAEALVRQEFPANSAAIADAAPLELPRLVEADYQPEPGKKVKKAELEELQEAREGQVALIFLAGFGECVVRANPAGSHGLLMTEPTSPGEMAAFRSLMPKFGGCLVAGQSLAFPKATLRGTIAMNYYRLAHAPRATAISAGAKN